METILVPVVLGAVLLAVKPLREGAGGRAAFVTLSLLLQCALAVRAAMSPQAARSLHLTEDVLLLLQPDGLSGVFLVMVAVLWALAGVFSFGYLKNDRRAGVFFGVYLIVYGTMAGVAQSGNLITVYLFYEMLTLTSSLLVFYEGTHEAIMAGLKYLFYSVAGAFLALAGIFMLSRMNEWLIFTPGGVALDYQANGGTGTVLAAAFLMVLGLAPAPASAVLSGLIVKAGVFFSIRVVYYIVGAGRLRGTWVQYAWLTLALVTVFMGSMLAYMEPVLKKRLAYSTVSQVSYILFGLALLTPGGFTGGLLHMVFHAVTKCGLFLAAGALIKQTGCTRVSELAGVGRAMPVTAGCFAVFALSLVGIPPFSGFVSKWYLATGVEGAGVGLFALIGPAVLLVSALLTAGYLFPLPVRGFFAPAKAGVKEAPAVMALPLVVLAALALGLGLFAQPLLACLAEIAGTVL